MSRRAYDLPSGETARSGTGSQRDVRASYVTSDAVGDPAGKAAGTLCPLARSSKPAQTRLPARKPATGSWQRADGGGVSCRVGIVGAAEGVVPAEPPSCKQPVHKTTATARQPRAAADAVYVSACKPSRVLTRSSHQWGSGEWRPGYAPEFACTSSRAGNLRVGRPRSCRTFEPLTTADRPRCILRQKPERHGLAIYVLRSDPKLDSLRAWARHL